VRARAGVGVDGQDRVDGLGPATVEEVRSAYGDADYRRLAAGKAAYDPANLFRLNHNIPPARGQGAAGGGPVRRPAAGRCGGHRSGMASSIVRNSAIIASRLCSNTGSVIWPVLVGPNSRTGVWMWPP
jgi:Berberine and berberine like